MGEFFKLSPTLGLLKGLFGSGETPRTLDDGGVDYSTEGIETLDAPYYSRAKPPVGGTSSSRFYSCQHTASREQRHVQPAFDQLRKFQNRYWRIY